MTKTLLAALLAATALCGAVAAQPKHDDHGPAGHGPPAHAGGHPGGGHGGGGAPARGPGRAQGPAQARAPRTQFHAAARPARAAPAQVRAQPQARRSAGPAARGAPVQAAGGRGGGFVYRGRPHERIQGPAFSYPRGYGYRRWGVGQYLPLLFLTTPYFFDSYADYGFGPPPSGYRWVRYGPDLLLVSRRTGRIREVIYGVFY